MATNAIAQLHPFTMAHWLARNTHFSQRTASYKCNPSFLKEQKGNTSKFRKAKKVKKREKPEMELKRKVIGKIQVYQRRGRDIFFGAGYHVGFVVYL